MSKLVLTISIVLAGILLGILHYFLKPAPDEKLLQQYAQNMTNSTEWQGRIAPDFELKTTRGDRFQLSDDVALWYRLLYFPRVESIHPWQTLRSLAPARSRTD